jgi:two-component system, NarL family, response regulator DesR
MKRLLLVDDNPLFREALALLLEWNMGLDSVQAASVAEARRILSGPRDGVGLAIVDIDLPGGDGIELIEELCEAETEITVLALTTGRSLQRYASALQAGAEEVLTLGTPIERLIDAIRRLAGGVEPEENNIRNLV